MVGMDRPKGGVRQRRTEQANPWMTWTAGIAQNIKKRKSVKR